MTCNDRFNQILDAWWSSEHPDARSELIARAEAEFGVERAVLAMDLSGFSRHTREHGPVPFLALIRHMRRSIPALIARHNGDVVKFHADNCMAHFPDALSAVNAARDVQMAVTGPEFNHDAAPPVRVAIGIASGPIFVLPATQANAEPGTVITGDIFGNAVNQAFRFGEDLAEAGEILLSAESAARVAGNFTSLPETRTYNDESVDVHVLQ